MHLDEMKDSTTELRIDAPHEIVAVLDAVSLAQRLNRNQLVLRVLAEWCDARVHEAMVLGRVAQGNPALSAKLGTERGQ